MYDRWQIDDLPVSHAASLQDRHLHALFVIQMNMERRLREIMMIVEVARQPFRQFALMVVVDIDQGGDALSGSADLRRVLLQTGSPQIAYRF